MDSFFLARGSLTLFPQNPSSSEVQLHSPLLEALITIVVQYGDLRICAGARVERWVIQGREFGNLKKVPLLSEGGGQFHSSSGL